MSSQPVSRSSTLRDPKFDDEIHVKRLTTATPVSTWKIVPSNGVKKLSFQDTTIKPMKSFTMKTANMFDGLREESCNSFHTDHTEPDVNLFRKALEIKLK